MARRLKKFLAFGWITYTIYSASMLAVAPYYLFEPPPNMGIFMPTIFYIIITYLFGWIPHPDLEWKVGWFTSYGDSLWQRVPLVLIIFSIPMLLWWQKQTFFRAWLLGVAGSLVGYAHAIFQTWLRWAIGIIVLTIFYLSLAALNELREKKYPDLDISRLVFWRRPWT